MVGPALACLAWLGWWPEGGRRPASRGVSGLPTHDAGARGVRSHRGLRAHDDTAVLRGGGRLGGAKLTSRALPAHGLPARQGFTIGDIPTRRGGMEVAEAGSLDGARQQRRRMVPGSRSGGLLRHRRG
jgi:hypothetical protein